MTTGKKIAQARKEMGRDWTQNRLAEALQKEGLTHTRAWVAGVETERIPPHADDIKVIAKVLKKPLDYFAVQHSVGFGHAARHGGEGLVKESSVEVPSDYVSLPIMGILPAGNPDDATASYRGNWEVRRRVLRGESKDHIVVEARGDSMTGLGIHDGDMLTVHLQPDAKDGQIVAAYVEGDGVTCKTLRKKGGKPCLEAANPDRKAPTGPFRIMGVVVWREGKPW